MLYACLILLLLVPQDAAARFARAVGLQQQGQFAEAAGEYRAALALKPDYVEAQANLGVVLARMGQYREAIAAYEAALRLAPQLTPIRLNLGIAHYRAGEFARAVEVFEGLLVEAPDALQARQLLGLSLVELGRDAEAVARLEPTLGPAPEDAAVLYGLGLAYLRLRRPEVRDVIDRLAAFPAGAGAARLLRGQALLAAFEFEKAIDELRAAERLQPDLPRLQYSLGLCYFKLGRRPEALAAFESELRRRPQDFTSLYYLANLEEAAGNQAAAERHLAAALKLAPDLPEANALQGKLLFKQGKAAEAVAPLEAAVARDPDDPDNRYLLARVYQRLGRREEAAREFAEVQRLKARQLEGDRARTPRP